MPIPDADLTTFLNNLRGQVVNVGKQVSTVKMRQGLTTITAAIDAELALVKPVPPAPPVPVKPQIAPTLTVVVVGSTATLTVTTGAEPVSGVDTYQDGADEAHKVTYDPLNVARMTVQGPVTVVRTHSGLAAGPHTLTASAYNDQGEGPQSVALMVSVGTPPVPPVPPPVVGAGLQGIYAYDQTFATTQTLEQTLQLVPATVTRPRLCILHLRHDTNWADTANVWFGADWTVAKRGDIYVPIVTIPMWPDQVGGSLQAAARGDYDGFYDTICANLATWAGGKRVWARYAHEANCCYQWNAEPDPTSYKGGWSHFAPIWRRHMPGGVNGNRLIFCPFYGDGNVPIETIEPDASLFDGYGMDYYGFNNWPAALNGPHGLRWVCQRAQQLVKPMTFCESNPATYPAHPTQNMTDDPAWMSQMWNVCSEFGADFCSYNDSNADVRSYLPDFPLNLARCQVTFGTAVPHQAPMPV